MFPSLTTRSGKLRKRIPLSLLEGHESTLPDWCIEHQISLFKLAKELELCSNVVYDLAYGRTAPIYLTGKRSGQTRKDAQAIIDFTGCSPAKLFPVYFCSIRKVQTGLDPDLLLFTEHFHSLTIDPEQQVLDKIYFEEMLAYLYKDPWLKPKYVEIFIRVHVFGETLEGIGKASDRSSSWTQLALNAVYKVLRGFLREAGDTRDTSNLGKRR